MIGTLIKMGNSFADTMKYEKFDGSNFKWWSTKLDFWSTAMDKFWVVKPCEGPLIVEKRVKFDRDNMKEIGCILGVMSDKLYDVYMNI